MKRSIKKIILFLCCFIFVFMSVFSGCEKGGEKIVRQDDLRNLDSYDYTKLNITATDEYGRVMTSADAKKTDKDRYVGIFFFFTLGQHRSQHMGIYNNTEILNKYGREGWEGDFPYSPVGQGHFWGEPVFGYYDDSDPWVIRKQIEMVTMLGLDFLMLDATNAVIYEKVADTFYPILLEYYNAGWDVPKIMYILNAGGDTYAEEKNITDLYNRYYKNPDYKDLWFAPNGKPLMSIAERTQIRLDSEEATAFQKELNDYFEFRTTVWPNDGGVDVNGFPWMDWTYPQKVYGDAINVSVAQHLTSKFSDTTGSHGRGWNWKTMSNDEDYAYGANMQSQWDTVMKNDNKVTYVIITGWNEWCATKFYEGGEYFMVDQYNDEFSRDIEPTRTGTLKDKFYIQTGVNIRNYAYEPAVHYNYPSVTVNMEDFDVQKWEQASVFNDFVGEAIPRNYPRFDGTINLEDYSNRNDIDNVSVLRDTENLYFRITTKDSVTVPDLSDKKWMNIWLRTNQDENTNSIGFHYVINKNLLSENTAQVLKFDENGNQVACGQSEFSISGNVLLVKVPLSALGLTKNNFEIEFKVSDNIKNDADILDFYSSGDSAPIGSMCYHYGY